MTIFETLATLLSLAGVFAYVNHRWLKLQAAIGVMALSLGFSLALVLVDRVGWIPIAGTAGPFLARIDFNAAVLDGMLGALLFAGALQVDVRELRAVVPSVAILSVAGTIISTGVVGVVVWLGAILLEARIPFTYALLFGALISPTDPVAVLGVLKTARVPKRLATELAGESLFNDGVGIVLYITVLRLIEHGDAGYVNAIGLFVRETGGGIAFGLASGYAVYRLLSRIDHYQTEVLLTISLVVGGYALAQRLHVSGPIAMVTAGLLIGNQERSAETTGAGRHDLAMFWEVVDDALNAVLFVLIGLEVIRIAIGAEALALGAVAIAAALVIRFVTVFVTLRSLTRWRAPARGEARILTWGGLRGGLSVALALSIPAGTARSLLVSTTYIVVVFSVIVQGLTLGRLARRVGAAAEAG